MDVIANKEVSKSKSIYWKYALAECHDPHKTSFLIVIKMIHIIYHTEQTCEESPWFTRDARASLGAFLPIACVLLVVVKTANCVPGQGV